MASLERVTGVPNMLSRPHDQLVAHQDHAHIVRPQLLLSHQEEESFLGQTPGITGDRSQSA